ncbi:MAG TPA: thioesterase family protein [Thermoleophilia bacterium]|nr:thioesterase family protein [Thermoleophilia bacterium]
MAGYGEWRCRVPLRVRFGETDAVGVANNAVYLSWFEVGRIEYLRSTGHDYAKVHAGGIDLVVVEASVRYLRPLRFDDEIDLHCWCSRLRRASVEFSYELWSRDVLCAAGSTLHACVDRSRMAPVRLPGWLVEILPADARG